MLDALNYNDICFIEFLVEFHNSSSFSIYIKKSYTTLKEKIHLTQQLFNIITKQKQHNLLFMSTITDWYSQ